MLPKRYAHEPSRNIDAREKSLRCCCGSLLARLVPGGVELKCRRCKRHVILPVENKIETRKTV
jgi:phage FluMu protein Com